MRALLDTNVLLRREPWFEQSYAVWSACDAGRIVGHISAVTFTDIFYIGRRIIGAAKALDGLRTCLSAFEVCRVDLDTVAAALSMPGSDFEDNLQIGCAMAGLLDTIITRDVSGFAHSVVPAVAPAEALARLAR